MNTSKYREAGLLKRDITSSWELVEKGGCSQAKELMNKIRSKTQKWVVMLGDTGVYKSVIASCMAKDYIDMGLSVKFGTAKEHIDSIYYADLFNGERREVVNELKTCFLLVIDEVGRASNTDSFRANIFDIIQYRDRQELQTVLATNLTESELWNSKHYLDVPMQRRCYENGFVIKFDSEVDK